MATDGMGGTDGTIKVDSGQTLEEQPTARLRFVERGTGLVCERRTIRILQQEWRIITKNRGVRTHQFEWRDVPLELEG